MQATNEAEDVRLGLHRGQRLPFESPARFRVVVSGRRWGKTTLDKAEWENTRLIKDNVAEEVGKLKQQAGKDMIVMGSSGLAVSLAEMGLVDEFRIMVNPVVLGEGKPVFSGIHGQLKLKLLKARTFGNGNVLLYYAPAAKAA